MDGRRLHVNPGDNLNRYCGFLPSTVEVSETEEGEFFDFSYLELCEFLKGRYEVFPHRSSLSIAVRPPGCLVERLLRLN